MHIDNLSKHGQLQRYSRCVAQHLTLFKANTDQARITMENFFTLLHHFIDKMLYCSV